MFYFRMVFRFLFVVSLLVLVSCSGGSSTQAEPIIVVEPEDELPWNAPVEEDPFVNGFVPGIKTGMQLYQIITSALNVPADDERVEDVFETARFVLPLDPMDTPSAAHTMYAFKLAAMVCFRANDRNRGPFALYTEQTLERRNVQIIADYLAPVAGLERPVKAEAVDLLFQMATEVVAAGTERDRENVARAYEMVCATLAGPGALSL